jgi:hypothetical protein
MSAKLVAPTTAIVALACCAAALSQEPVPAVPSFGLVGTREVSEAKGTAVIPGGVGGWRMTDPSKARGLVVSIKATFPPGVTDLDSSALALSYTTGGASRRAVCLGVTLQGSLENGGQWFLADPETGVSLNLNAQGSTLEASFLYAVPPTVSEVSLAYREKVVLKAIPLTWKPGHGESGFQEQPPPREHGATREYLDTTNGLSFQYPAAWKEIGPDEARRVMGAVTSKNLTVLVYDPADWTQNVNVQVLPTAATDLTEASYSKFEKEMDGSMPSAVPGFRKVSSRVGRLLDMASLEYVWETTRPDGVRLRQMQLRTGKPGREVAATFTARADLYEMSDATCFKIILDTLNLK